MSKAEQILKNLLLQIAKEQNFEDYDLKINPISSGGANFSSTLFNGTFTKNENVVHMFAKVAAAGERLRSQAPMVYETEIFAYTKLVEVYRRLEEEHRLRDEDKLKLPKFYGCNATEYEETIVLEDLVDKGYVAFDRFKCFNLQYATCALTELAKMHALAFAYGAHYPDEYKEVIDKVTKGNWVVHAGPSLVGFFETVFAKALENVREENKDKLQRFFETFDKASYADFYRTSGLPVLGHGDFRPGNLMHKILDDGTMDIKIVDLQTLHGGSPVVDLLYFIFSGSDEQFREKHYEQLLDHYYNQLCVSMKRLNLDPDNVYSKENFQTDLREKLAYGFLVAVLMLPTMLVKDTPELSEDLELSNFCVKESSDLYVERLNGVINDYVKWGVLK